VMIIENIKNAGYAGGNNVGIKYALDNNADYIWLLNNDTTVDSNALSALVDLANEDQKIAMVGSKILNYYNNEIIEFVGGHLSLYDGKTSHIGYGEKDTGQYDNITRTEYVTGASLLVSASAIKNIGLMDEDYFLYYEETDWCVRARIRGYTLAISPKSIVYHKVSVSTSKSNSQLLYYMTRNRLFFLERNGRNVRWLSCFYSDFKNVYLAIKNRHKNLLDTIYNIFIAYYHWIFRYAGPVHSPEKIDSRKKI
jgi:GT2 family glycosyltransferase